MIMHTDPAKSKRPHMSTEASTHAPGYLSRCRHTGVTPLLSIYPHRVTGSSDKTRRKRICLRLPVTLSHCHAPLYPYILEYMYIEYQIYLYKNI